EPRRPPPGPDRAREPEHHPQGEVRRLQAADAEHPPPGARGRRGEPPQRGEGPPRPRTTGPGAALGYLDNRPLARDGARSARAVPRRGRGPATAAGGRGARGRGPLRRAGPRARRTAGRRAVVGSAHSALAVRGGWGEGETAQRALDRPASLAHTRTGRRW